MRFLISHTDVVHEKGLLGCLSMTCIAATVDEDDHPMHDGEPALKDLRVVLQCCDDVISHELFLGSLVENNRRPSLMHTVS